MPAVASKDWSQVVSPVSLLHLGSLWEIQRTLGIGKRAQKSWASYISKFAASESTALPVVPLGTGWMSIYSQPSMGLPSFRTETLALCWERLNCFPNSLKLFLTQSLSLTINPSSTEQTSCTSWKRACVAEAGIIVCRVVSCAAQHKMNTVSVSPINLSCQQEACLFKRRPTACSLAKPFESCKFINKAQNRISTLTALPKVWNT